MTSEIESFKKNLNYILRYSDGTPAMPLSIYESVNV